MSSSRGGRRGDSHSEYPPIRPFQNNPRWPNQGTETGPPFENNQPTAHPSDRGNVWANDSWGWQQPQQPGFGGWDFNNAHPQNMMWPQPPQLNMRNTGPPVNNARFQVRFPAQPNVRFSAPRPGMFSERSLGHLNQTPLEQLTTPIGNRFQQKRGGSSLTLSERWASTHSNRDSRQEVDRNHNMGSKRKPISPPALGTSGSFLAPNNADLANKVKASLKQFQANKDQIQPAPKPATEPLPAGSANLSRNRVRESRVSGNESSSSSASTSSHTQNDSTRMAGVPRPRRESQSKTPPASGSGTEPRTPEGSSPATQKPADKGASIRNRRASSTSDQEGSKEPRIAFTKEAVNSYIKSMDNNRRKQLVDQPRDRISQLLVSHLVQESHNARARQLSALRFAVSANDAASAEHALMTPGESPSRVDGEIYLPEALMDDVMEALRQEDSSSKSSADIPPPAAASVAHAPPSEDDEIEILPPPVKTPPPVIDLDCDDRPSPLREPQSVANHRPPDDPMPAPLASSSAKSAAPVAEAGLPVAAAVAVPEPVPGKVVAAERTPAQVAPVRKTPAEVAPVQKTPAQVAPVQKTPAQVAPVQKTPAQVAPVQKPPAQVAPVQKPPAQVAPVQKPPAEVAPAAGETALGKAAIDRPANVVTTTSSTLPITVATEKPVSDGGTASADVPPMEVEETASSALDFMLTDIQLALRQHNDRIRAIDEEVERLLKERKHLASKITDLNQLQFDTLRTALPANLPEEQPSVPKPALAISGSDKNAGCGLVITNVQSLVADAVEVGATATPPSIRENPCPVVPRVAPPPTNITASISGQKRKQTTSLDQPSKKVALSNSVGTEPSRSSTPTPSSTNKGKEADKTRDSHLPNRSQSGSKAAAGPDPASIQRTHSSASRPEPLATSSSLPKETTSLKQPAQTNQVTAATSTSSPKRAPPPQSVTNKNDKPPSSAPVESISQPKNTPAPSPSSASSSSGAKRTTHVGVEKQTMPAPPAPVAKTTKSNPSTPSSASTVSKSNPSTPSSASTASKTNPSAPSSASTASKSKVPDPTSSTSVTPPPSTTVIKHKLPTPVVPSPPVRINRAKVAVVSEKSTNPRDSSKNKTTGSAAVSHPCDGAMPSTSADHGSTRSTTPASAKKPVPEAANKTSRSNTPNQSSGPTRVSKEPPQSSLAESHKNATQQKAIDKKSTATPTTPREQPSLAGPSRTEATDPTTLNQLDAHTSSVRCLFISGPCLFSASDDGTVHIYDMSTGQLILRVLGHQEPVTWLYAVSLRATTETLKSLLGSTTDYLNQLHLITGSNDGYIRQFELKTTGIRHELCCGNPVTCVAGNKDQARLYVGSNDGQIYIYNPKLNTLAIAAFKGEAEIICLKVVRFRGNKRVIIVAARRKDPVIYDLATDEKLYVLNTNTSTGSSIYSITSHMPFIFCTDAMKNVFTFDTNNPDKFLVRTDTLPSLALNSYHINKRYLVLGCMDGVVRVLDTCQKSSSIVTKDLPGEHMKTLACMKVYQDKVVCGSLAGEISWRTLPDLASLFKK